MDKPADPATPFREVYQHFLAILATRRRKQTTLAKYLYDYQRFERWLRQTGRAVTLASLMDPEILFAYRQHLETLPQQARGSIRRRRNGMMSIRTVHSYLGSTKCLASWLTKNGYIPIHPFLAEDPYFKEEGIAGPPQQRSHPQDRHPGRRPDPVDGSAWGLTARSARARPSRRGFCSPRMRRSASWIIWVSISGGCPDSAEQTF